MKADDAEIFALVSDPEVEAAALAMASRLGKLFGAARPEDKKMLREAAKAGLYAAAMVRMQTALMYPLDVDSTM